jgi:uncharacterized membrane protein YgcG
MLLLTLGTYGVFSLRSATTGVHVFGRTGGGKSSALATLAAAYLRANMGGIVCCAKSEEVDTWLNYCRENGRLSSVIVFDGSRGGFNFIAYELARQGVAGIGSVVECLMHILDASDVAAGGGKGRTSDEFWGQSIRQLLNYCLPLLYAAWGTVSVGTIIEFVVTAATKPEQYVDEASSRTSFAARTMRKAADHPAVALPEGELRTLITFWFKQYTAMADKTRSNVVTSLTTRLDRFLHGRLKDAFCGDTSIVPEMTFGGAIIILAMPALTWNEDGVIGQQLFKFMWQRAVEARNALHPRLRARPVFLWADEAQYFVNAKDDAFLSTCRASRACVVYITQNLPTYVARLGQDNAEVANAIVGKFGTQLFFSNLCHKTNTHASELIGRGIQLRGNHSRSVGTNRSKGLNENTNTNYSRGTNSSSGSNWSGSGGGGSHSSGSNVSSGSGEGLGANVGSGTNRNTSWGVSEQMDNLVEPRFFATGLLSGGPRCGNLVTAVWCQADAEFTHGITSNTAVVTFRQGAK